MYQSINYEITGIFVCMDYNLFTDPRGYDRNLTNVVYFLGMTGHDLVINRLTNIKKVERQNMQINIRHVLIITKS